MHAYACAYARVRLRVRPWAGGVVGRRVRKPPPSGRFGRSRANVRETARACVNVTTHGGQFGRVPLLAGRAACALRAGVAGLRSKVVQRCLVVDAGLGAGVGGGGSERSCCGVCSIGDGVERRDHRWTRINREDGENRGKPELLLLCACVGATCAVCVRSIYLSQSQSSSSVTPEDAKRVVRRTVAACSSGWWVTLV